MKIIFSRKGFDSGAGGCASPIIDGHLVSLPIPDSTSPISYAEVQHAQVGSLGPIVESLTRGRVRAESGAHLDPDLDIAAIARKDGWRPLFGQVDAAQSHLLNKGVTKGDLFLMFGWFREAERFRGGFRYPPSTRDVHVLYGWLQIGDVLHLGSNPQKGQHPTWSHYHPHFYGTRALNNVLYVASERLAIDGVDAGVAGAGRWTHHRIGLQLTDPASGNRATWKLPHWFNPDRSAEPLSYHGARERWTKLEDGYRLSSVGRGQEFVFDTAIYPEAGEWIRDTLLSR